MLPMKQAIKRRFSMPPQVTCSFALPGKTGNTKIVFFTRCISALLEFNQSLLDFFNLFDSRLILTLPYDSLNLVKQGVRLGAFGGAWYRRKEIESAAAVGLCCTHQCAVF